MDSKSPGFNNMVVKRQSIRLHSAHYSAWLVVLGCLIGAEGAAQAGARPTDFHVVAGIHAGPAIMLAPFEYTAYHPELEQPSPRPGYSFYNVFAGIEFWGNEILFSYGDLPMACGYVINDAQRGDTYYDYGFVALNTFFALSYKRELWKRKRSNLGGRRKRWSFYAGGYVGMANSPPGVGGPASSRKIIIVQENRIQFEAQLQPLIDRSANDYFISFGPEAQLRFHAGKWVKLFLNTSLRITPHVVRAYRLSYNLYPTPESEPKTTEIRSKVLNVHISFGILLDLEIKKRSPEQELLHYPSTSATL